MSKGTNTVTCSDIPKFDRVISGTTCQSGTVDGREGERGGFELGRERTELK